MVDWERWASSPWQLINKPKAYGCRALQTGSNSSKGLIHHSGVTFQDYLYLFGGYSIESKETKNDLYKIGPLSQINNATLQCTKIEPGSDQRPEPRSHHTATIINNKMYIIGGAWFAPSSATTNISRILTSKYYNDVWEYHFYSKKWRLIQIVDQPLPPIAGPLLRC